MKPETLPIGLLRGSSAPIEHRIAIDLPADLYSLDELRHIVRVLEKYKLVCEMVDLPTCGGVQ